MFPSHIQSLRPPPFFQDVLRRFVEVHPEQWDVFAAKTAFQLNDTHPTIAVAELMRLLMDEHRLGWTKSWDICTKVITFLLCLRFITLNRMFCDDRGRVMCYAWRLCCAAAG